MSRIGVWSAIKVAFLLGVLFGVITFLVMIVGWNILSVSGTLTQVEHLISSDLTSSNSIAKSIFGFKTALTVSAVCGLLTVVSVTILGAIAAALYDLFVHPTGGAVVGFEPANHP